MSNPKYAKIAAALLASLACGAAQAQSLASSMGIYVYPAQNQDAAKQSEDDYGCFGWAKQQSGYVPINPPQATAQIPKEGLSGGRLRGAARGATAGAVVSEITDNDTSDAMAAGAVLGTMRGGRQERVVVGKIWLHCGGRQRRKNRSPVSLQTA